MNITHSEPRDSFLSRYGARWEQIEPLLDSFGPEPLREWMHGLGRILHRLLRPRVSLRHEGGAPVARMAARLREAGVIFHMRHRWRGWDERCGLRFSAPGGEHSVRGHAVVLALGGGSLARLESDGAWVPLSDLRSIWVAR